MHLYEKWHDAQINKIKKLEEYKECLDVLNNKLASKRGHSLMPTICEMIVENWFIIFVAICCGLMTTGLSFMIFFL